MKIYQELPGLFFLIDDVSNMLGKVSGSSRKQIADLNTTEKTSKIEFYVTDFGNLLRTNKEKWQVFNTKDRRWEKHAFDINDIPNSLSVSPQEAGEIVRYLLRSSH